MMPAAFLPCVVTLSGHRFQRRTTILYPGYHVGRGEPWDATGSEEAMSSRRLAIRVALFATIPLAGLLAAGPTHLGLPRSDIARGPAIEDSWASPASTLADPVASTQIAKSESDVAIVDAAIPDTAPLPATAPILEPTLPVPASAAETPSFQLASLSPPDPVPGPVKEA